MSALDQLVRLDDYQTYLKYRKPPGTGYNQKPGKKNVWVPTESGGYEGAVVVDESDANVTVVQLTKDESVRFLSPNPALPKLALVPRPSLPAPPPSSLTLFVYRRRFSRRTKSMA